MMHDRKGQVWQIRGEEFDVILDRGSIRWKTFTVVSTSQTSYETISGENHEFVKHKVVVSDSGAVVELNEDIAIPWEECDEEYRRVA